MTVSELISALQGLTAKPEDLADIEVWINDSKGPNRLNEVRVLLSPEVNEELLIVLN